MEWQRDLGIIWDRIGDIHQAEGDFEQAIHAYTEAMKIAECLARWIPDHPQLQRDLETSYRKLGVLYKSARDDSKSLDLFRAASSTMMDDGGTWSGPFAR